MKILKGLAKLAVFTFGVALLTWVGLQLGIYQDPLSPFWPTNGYVLAALLVRPKRDWPWLVVATGLGAAIADAHHHGQVHIYLVVPMFEPLIAASLIHRFAGVAHTPPSLSYWVRTMLCAPVVSAGIGGAVGAALLLVSYPTYDFVSLMRAWWFSDALGHIVMAPALISLLDPLRRAETRKMLDGQSLELAAFASLFLSLTVVVFSASPDPSGNHYEFHHAVMPILIWAALRFPAWVSFNCLAVYAGFSAWQMQLGHGPFVADGQVPLGLGLAYQVPTLMTAIGVQMVQVLATERRIASEFLAGSERRFRGIVESTNEWLWEVDIDMRFVYSSPHCLPLLGYTPEELLGTDSMPLIIPEDRARASHAFESSIGRQLPVLSFVHRKRRKDGRIVDLESNVVPILDEHGHLVGCRGADRDVTARVEAERLAASLLEEQVQSEKLVALGTVVTGVAHEINNPNQFITLNMPILRQAWADAGPAIDEYARGHRGWKVAGIPPADAKLEVAEAIDEVAEGSDRIRTIVSELRDYMRGDSSGSPETVDVSRSARSALNVVVPSIESRGQRVVVETLAPIPSVRGDRRRIEQILINLIANASEALGERAGTVSIRTSLSEDGRFVRVEVVDDGPGIAPPDLLRVMDPFFTTKRDLGGMGLGLAISSRIAREHGGRLELESEPGKGTTARLVLPVSD